MKHETLGDSFLPCNGVFSYEDCNKISMLIESNKFDFGMLCPEFHQICCELLSKKSIKIASLFEPIV